MPAAISWTNHITNGYPAAPVLVSNMTSASVDAAYPIENYLTDDPSRVTRINYVNTSGADRVVILRKQISAANDKTIRVVAAMNVRLPAGAWNSLWFGLFNVALAGANYAAHSPAVVVPIPGTTDRYNVYAVLAADVPSLAYVEFAMQAPTGTNSYFEVGHVWAGPGLVLPDGVDRDWKLTPVDPSEVERLRLGALVAQRLPTRQKFSAPVTRQAYSTALGTDGSPTALNFRSLFREAGLSAPVVIVPRSSSTHAAQVAGIYGALTKLADVSHQRGNRFAVELEAEEIR